MRRSIVALLLLGILAAAAFSSIVVLDERQQAFRTLLGDPEPALLPLPAVIQGPALAVRIPLLHQMSIYTTRLQRFDAEARELLTSENLPVEVDYYLMWRVEDPRKLFENTNRGPGGEPEVLRLLDDTAFNEVRTSLGQRPFAELLSATRETITREIAENADRKLDANGISVVDFRIRRTEYPEENLATIYRRMRTERERVAKRYRAEGEEEASKIRAQADRDSTVERARAARDAARLRGEGDAESARIYAEAYDQDREFYVFVRSLEAYRGALDEQTTMILSDKNPFLKYLLGPTP